ncbi:MAG TPA: Na+/H+ antiporter [Solirubrobacteraceae bacterium]|nr:Na+/H+ antiporter [Solirubrobacteraceae bacterium]
MHGADLLILLGVLVASAGLLILAGRLAVPYPILLVAGGTLLGLVPGIPDVTVQPDLILLVALPPLLYQAAFFSSLHELRDNARPILSLSIGLVVATTAGVAAIGHAVAGLPWATAFILGAVLSPTDPVAATAIASRVGAPRRFVTLVEGESLVNDGTGLTLYKLAVVAAVAGGVTLAGGTLTFFANAAGGIAIGIVAAWVIGRVRSRIADAPTEIVVSLLSPYVAYLPAEAAGVSAVLAAVTCGIVLGWRNAEHVAPATRLQSFATWEVVVFALNTFVFVLIGISLPEVVDRIEGASAAQLARDAVAVVLTVVVVRFAWTYLVGALPRLVRARGREDRDGPPWREVLLVAFTGMRGAVGVAAALAVPVATDAGAPLEGRDLVIFLTYAVVFATVVGQGLALPVLIRRLYPAGAGDELDREESQARVAAARAALQRLEEVGEGSGVQPRTLRRLHELYRFRLERYEARASGDGSAGLEEDSIAYQRLRIDLLGHERDAIIALRRAGAITDDVLHRVEHDLDLDEARLEVSEGVGPHGRSPLALGDEG